MFYKSEYYEMSRKEMKLFAAGFHPRTLSACNHGVKGQGAIYTSLLL
jgi:hypothetical protein